jgi:hypothetical protein
VQPSAIRSRLIRVRAFTLAYCLYLVGCSMPEPILLPVRTDPAVRRAPPIVGGCDSWGAGQPVAGRLEIEPNGDVAETWVVTEEGVQLSVIWPFAFSARPAEGLLVDDRGHVIFRDGEQIRLGQVSRKDASGTAADPYVATGIFGNGCWLRQPLTGSPTTD